MYFTQMIAFHLLSLLIIEKQKNDIKRDIIAHYNEHHAYRSESPAEDLKETMTFLLKCPNTQAYKIPRSDLRNSEKENIFRILFFF